MTTRGINMNQLREYVVTPVLKHLDPVIPYSLDAENLILGTIAQESHGSRYIHQLGAGPAVGMCQMEPNTHDDIWENYIKYNKALMEKIKVLELSGWYDEANAKEMAGNNYYAVAMCRVHYRRKPQALPKHDDIAGMGAYWKKYYNTYLGAGTVEEFIENYNRFLK